MPLKPTEIEGWLRLNGIKLTHHEVAILFAADRQFISSVMEHNKYAHDIAQAAEEAKRPQQGKPMRSRSRRR